ncbi:MAG: DnaJ domain-containing protein [Methylococcales bacterium]|nr:DnaJ domain-containing protein [Methylococcales bacterium]
MSKIHTHYDNLKIAQNAPDAIIKAAYQTFLENYRPEKFNGVKQQEAQKITAIIQQSHDILLDPFKRAEHDKWILEQEKKVKKIEIEPMVEIVGNEKVETPTIKNRKHSVFNRSTAVWAMGLSLASVVAVYGYVQYPTLLTFEIKSEFTPEKVSAEEIYYHANELAKENRYAEALPLFQYLADNGNVVAQSHLGLIYEKGQGVAQNYELAAQWYQKAANQQLAFAQRNLELAHSNAQNAPQNSEEAGLWFQKAAEKGDVLAQFKLGELYEKGQGLPQNYSLAAQWYEKAAEKEHVVAQFNLGVLYEKGQGVPQNYSNAVQWYQKAAIQGNAAAQYNLGIMYEKGLGVPQNIVSSAQWYQDASTSQDDGSQYTDAAYIHAQSVPQNFEAAIQWYQKAVNQGHAAAQYNLGVMYEKGQFVPKNSVVAYSLFNLSAAIDASTNNPAIELRNRLVNEMLVSQIEIGQNLTQKMMSEKNNVTKIIDQFLAMK